MAINFINMDRDQFLRVALFKYMPLERALDMLNSSQMWFANPTTWEDPFEKRFVETQYLVKRAKIPFPWKDRVFCTCISKNSNCEAYWNTYSKNDIGISFSIDPEKLLTVLEKYEAKNDVSIFIGAVEYQKTEQIKGNLAKNPFIGGPVDLKSDETKAKLLLLKRNAFKYEEEIRIIIVKKSGTKERGIKVDYDIPYTDLVKMVKIDPRADKNVVNLLKKVFDSDYHFSPASKRVHQSGIYKGEVPSYIKL